MIFGQVMMVAMVLSLVVPLSLFAQTPPNQAPVAGDDSAVTLKNTAVIVDVLSNDSDQEGPLDPSKVTTETAPAHGGAVYNGDGTFTYTPSNDFTGTDTFVYKVCDSATSPLCDTATVTIDVAIPASFRIIPQKLNVKKMGVIPVVVFSTGDLDVADIDPASIRLEGVAPIRSNAAGGGPHGSKRLNLKFRAQEIVAAIGDVQNGEEIALQLTGNLNDDAGGGAFIGEDTVIILNRGSKSQNK